MFQVGLERKNILVALAVTLFFLIVFPPLFSNVRLMFFAPYLIISFYQKSYITCLWHSFLAGLVLDLLSTDGRLGLYGLGYCLTTALLYNQRRHFFSDSPSTLPIMTFFFAVISTLIEFGLVNAFEKPLTISWGWIQTDVFYMPVLDALYAFFVFILPALVWGKRARRGNEYFM